MDELLVRVEATPQVYAAGDGAIATYAQRASEALRRVLGVRAKVEVAEGGSIPRTDFKARRVIDDRDLFRTLNAKLET